MRPLLFLRHHDVGRVRVLASVVALEQARRGRIGGILPTRTDHAGSTLARRVQREALHRRMCRGIMESESLHFKSFQRHELCNVIRR